METDWGSQLTFFEFTHLCEVLVKQEDKKKKEKKLGHFIKACREQKITAGELTAPFLKKGGLPRRSHHATDIVTLIKSPAGNLPPQGSRSTNHQNLHGGSQRQGELSWRTLATRVSVLLELQKKGATCQAHGNQHPEHGCNSENFRSH